ncbi:MAG: (deoxy)nucleoside triphosphate pyrophosphohydrolase [Clostridia bacterium]|jgi:8-oxo-dGTP diphosphatase
MIQVAAAILKNERGEILICQRGPGGSCAYLWEFPGGKLEPHESLEECLIRECREELAVGIAVKGKFAETTFQYAEAAMAFTFFYGEIIEGTPRRGVHKDIRWVSPGELKNFKFCPADVEVAERLMRHA